MIVKNEKLTIAVVGAGGKMGTRITNNLVKENVLVKFCEKSKPGIQSINERGYEVSDTENAVKESDVVVLAVPDTLIGTISEEIVPNMKSGAMLITLDPAAAYADQIKLRDDVNFVVTHPCHPSVFAEHTTPEEHADVFGGVASTQDIVIALHKGEESCMKDAEDICISMFEPVKKCHRITVEHMAILEPTAAEVVTGTMAVVIKEALEEVVKKGVPREAAESFILGHIQICLAVALKGTNPFSDACEVAIDYGKEKILASDWKDVFTQESLNEVLQEMLEIKK
ncbi:phosphogluconate dehydrogenase C-terminal domain-containing protein [Alteribacillus sp. YIM 98480]|uniref:phosphogluconate dehydrogenase C-terminal domain-containing protein n=1 Tax=Alteribacillus sp. YIM 98480 TaxID=2606599 RepID=UPI00131EC7D9|nr:phosphogluconate dehydrogenase C-terminal domain-containing protein [Alteribacillus sp. YIM 98480]